MKREARSYRWNKRPRASSRKERAKRINDSTRGNFLLEFKGTLISRPLYITLRNTMALLDRSPCELPANDSRIRALYLCKRVSKRERHGQRVLRKRYHFRSTLLALAKIITARTLNSTLLYSLLWLSPRPPTFSSQVLLRYAFAFSLCIPATRPSPLARRTINI